MTARKRRIRLAIRHQSRSYAWAPEVRWYGESTLREHAAVISLQRRDTLDRISVVTTHALTASAFTIQRP
jgi:hypothetical protein